MQNSPFWEFFIVFKSSSDRLITYSNELIDGKPLFVSSNSSPIKSSKNFEPAGHSFHILALKYFPVYIEPVSEIEFSQGINNQSSTLRSPSSGSSIYTNGDKDYFGNGGMKNSDSSKNKGSQESTQIGSSILSLDLKDHYGLLGLGHLRFLATEEQIRKAFRDAALKFHPDKLASLILSETTESGKLKLKEEVENTFNSIQVAYEVLSDKAKRRVYDSTDFFDDTIPGECDPSSFYEIYDPVFRRNGKWSINPKVPVLGVETTPIEQVERFYKFWFSFKSWREFPSADEYDINETESRDEKRWAEKMNAKMREKSKKVERSRIHSLVENAYKCDPRIKKRNRDEKLAKQRAKELRNQGKKAKEEESRKAAEEERIQKEREAKFAFEDALIKKRLKEKEKKLLQKGRSRLRTLSASVVSQRFLGVSKDDVEKLCASFNKVQLQLLADSVDGKDDSEKALLIKQALHGDCNNGISIALSNGN